MELPFSQTQFLEVFAAYNAAIWPLQIATLLLGVLAIVLVFSACRWSDRIISAVLALLWALMGIGYHWLYFSTVNPAAWIFGGLFMLAASVFLIEGTIRDSIRFRPRTGISGWVATVLIVYGIAVYPATSLLVTHPYPQTPLFGVAPCPTTIFTLGMLLLAKHPTPFFLAALPIIWSLIGASAAILLDVPQDLALIVAAAAWFACHPPS